MATNPRSKTPNDAALSAVEDALRLDFTEEDADEGDAAARDEPRRERRPEARAGNEPPRRDRRAEQRIPAPPRRNEQAQAAAPRGEARRDEPRREEPRREEPRRDEVRRDEARRPERAPCPKPKRRPLARAFAPPKPVRADASPPTTTAAARRSAISAAPRG